MSRLRAVSMALVSVITLEGCALMMTQPPPPNYETLPYFDCDSSFGPAIADTVLALAFAGFATAVHTQRDEFGDTPLPLGPYIAGILVWTGLFGTSAFLGYTRAAHCQDAKEDLEARITTGPS